MVIKDIVHKYCSDVISGKRVAGQLEKLAVKRYYDDLKNSKKKGFYFDERAAEKAIRFFSFLKHSKGEFRGRPFVLEPWQMFVDWNIFGWKWKEDDARRFTYSYIEVARKNGKSTFAAGNGLLFLDADDEPGAEVYSFATKEEQAKLVFTEAKNMIKSSEFLSEALQYTVKSIYSESNLSFFKPLGSDSDTQDGLNTHAGICDEYHAHKNDNMMNVIKSSMGARRNPHIMTITTAGITIGGACHTERNTCVKILQGVIEQENKFAIIYTLDEGDDWEDEKVWPKSNPSLSAIPTLGKFLKKEYIDAKNNPSRINNFKTKNLNIWCSSEIDYISDQDWMKCNFKFVDLDTIRGRRCYAAIDLAKRVDLNALAIVTDDSEISDIYMMFWIPRSKMINNPDDVNYQGWAHDGYITICGEDAVNMEEEAEQIVNILAQVDLQGTAIDTAYAEFGVGEKLNERGIEVTAFRQGYISMTPPINELEAQILSRRLNHGGNPVLRWNNSNVALWQDPAGNRKIHKGKSKGRVDGMVALVMAVGLKMAAGEQYGIEQYYLALKAKNEQNNK